MKLFTLFFFCFGLLSAQELGRRPLLGVRLTPLYDDVVRLKTLPSEKGVLVDEIIPGSTAEKAGIQKGDVLLKLNNTEITTPAQAVSLVARLNAGDKLSYEILRKGKTIQKQTTLLPLPFEKHQGIEMQYSAVQTVNGLQRIIISRLPDQQKRPVIVFIGGIGCYSLDFPTDPNRPEVELLNGLTREGFVCVRPEKPGVGDNRNCTPCAEVSFMNESRSYAEVIRKVKTMPGVDSSRVYIFGHSMGGVMAPLIAGQTSVRGIIAYGTIGSNFLEYLVKTRRTLAQAYNMSPEETDTYIKDCCECSTWYFADKLSTQEATDKKSDCKEYLSILDLRSRAYNNELYGLNIPALWKNYQGSALLLYGQQDFIASKEDHEIIAETVNHYHAGHGTMLIVNNASHGMTVANSYAEALKNDGNFQPEVLNVVKHWLQSRG